MNDHEHRRKSLADDLEVDLDLNAVQNDRDRQNHVTEADHVINHANVATDHVVVGVTALAIAALPRVTMKVVTRNLILWRFSICTTKQIKMSFAEFSSDTER